MKKFLNNRVQLKDLCGPDLIDVAIGYSDVSLTAAEGGRNWGVPSPPLVKIEMKTL